MTRIVVLPHVEACPEGAVFEAEPGAILCQSLLDHGVVIEHACEMACACTTCHVIVREGFEGLDPSDELEDDRLDQAWGLEPHSRLSCQVLVAEVPLVIEIPRYSINLTQEGLRK